MTAINAFRANLRAAMREQGITQRELARRTDLALSYVSQLLTGRGDRGTAPNPTLHVCEKICKVVGRPLHEMLVSSKADKVA